MAIRGLWWRVAERELLWLQADELLSQQKQDKEYLPITGLGEFTDEAIKLAYGKESVPFKEGRVSACFRCCGVPTLGRAFAWAPSHDLSARVEHSADRS